MNSLKNKIELLVKRNVDLVKLAGEASYREYYRAKLDDGSTLMIMKMPAGIASASEEITKNTSQITELPFINVQKYLLSLSLPIPKIKAVNLEDGILVLEDLGDQSFEKELLASPREKWVSLYQKAIDLLVNFQVITKSKPASDCVAFYRQFDADLLVWELNHFLEYGVTDRLGITIESGDHQKFQQIFQKIAAEIVAMPQGLTHRDFQSRNLHWYQGQLFIIDFQDTLKGPLIYDLVALLRDSYVQLTIDERTALVNYYASLTTEALYKDPVLCQRHVDLQTVQRKLKDAGRFQYIKTVKGNPKFMAYFPSSMDYVKEALSRLPDYSQLWDLLVKYVPEYRV